MLTDYEEILKEIWEENPHLFRSFSEVQVCCNGIIRVAERHLTKGEVFQFGSEVQFIPNAKREKQKSNYIHLRNEFIDDIFE